MIKLPDGSSTEKISAIVSKETNSILTVQGSKTPICPFIMDGDVESKLKAFDQLADNFDFDFIEIDDQNWFNNILAELMEVGVPVISLKVVGRDEDIDTFPIQNFLFGQMLGVMFGEDF